MQFKQYPSYKNSGVEWLGEVPEHWTVLKNRHIFNFSKGLSITKENLQESGIPCVSYGEVHSKFGFEFNPEINDLKFVSEEYLKTSKNCLLNSGDFIFADTSEDFEGSGNFSYLNSKSQVFAGYHTVIARLKFSHNPRFFAYVFDSNAHRKQIQTQVKGIKVFSITQGILKDIYSWLPPIDEQQKIVLFLDTETARIDTLIAKQEKLIELLEEQRKSIISHAVTKGLNPNAPMKDSGVEWLGEVPEHWGVNRLGVHFKNRKEKVSDKDFKPLSVTKHGIVPQLEHAAKSDNGDNRKLVRKGDYVINSRSDRKGSSGLADLDGSVSLINIVLTPFKTIHPKFSHYLLRSYLFQEEFYKYGHGIVADLWTTNYEDMRNIHLALPSVSEQTQISNFLEQETTRIDNLIAKQEKLIEKLKEYRASIISHAVTGKIDVREFGA